MLVTLSVSDKLILDAMCNVVDGIAAMYGQHTEVALHSLDIENPSIIKIGADSQMKPAVVVEEEVI